jgi:hypothetical protein
MLLGQGGTGKSGALPAARFTIHDANLPGAATSILFEVVRDRDLGHIGEIDLEDNQD